MGYKNKEVQRIFGREWVAKRRRDWINSKGGKCVRCGYTENLEVDHIDPKLKMITPANLWSMAEKNERRILELEKCQILCYECHLNKTVSERIPILEHGVGSGYGYHKCRCTECRAWNARNQQKKRDRYKLQKELQIAL